MFCPYCGKEMADNAAYCGFCGAKNEAVKSTANPTYRDTSTDPSEKSGSYTAGSARCIHSFSGFIKSGACTEK